MLQESDVEYVPTINDLIYSLPIRKQEKSLNKYTQSLTSSQLLIKTDDLSINFELSDSESEEFTLREKSLQDISAVGYNFREPYKSNGNTEHINFTVANLNLIVKKQNEHNNENIPVAIKLEQDTNESPIIYSMAYHFNTSSAENEEKTSVERRLKSADKIIDSLKLVEKNTKKIKQPKIPISKKAFNRLFRHSEQALFEYLKTENCISYLMGLMLENKVVKLQSVVLDMHSTKSMCKNCQYSTYGVLSDRIEQQNQEFCGKLERSIRGYNRGRSRDNIIRIGNEDKKRTTFYRAVRLVFSEFFDHQFENQHKFMLNSPIYIQNINKRIIAKEYTDKSSERYGLLIRDYTIFCSRGESKEKRLIKQLKTDRKRSKNETNTKNNGGKNRNLERENSAVEE